MKFIFKAMVWLFVLVVSNGCWLLWNPFSYARNWNKIKRNNRELWDDIEHMGEDNCEF